MIHFNNLSRLEAVILQKSIACILVSTSYKVVNIISCECIHSIRLRWTSPNESQANRWSWPGNVMESWLLKPLSLSVSVILTQTEEWGGYTFCTTFLPILIIRQLSSLQDTALSQYQTLPLFARYIYTSNLCAKIVSIAQNQGDCICEILDCLNHNENNFISFFLIFTDLSSRIGISMNEYLYRLKIIKNVH